MGILGQKQEEVVTVFCDSSSTIKLSRNPVMHGRTKHIDVCFHFLRELRKDGNIELTHCVTFRSDITNLNNKIKKYDENLIIYTSLLKNT